MGIIDSIQHWANVSPDQTAHISADRSLTYGELARRSDILADHFLHTFPAADTRRPIAIYGHKEPELFVPFLAAVKSAHPNVPIHLAIPPHPIHPIHPPSSPLQ